MYFSVIHVYPDCFEEYMWSGISVAFAKTNIVMSISALKGMTTGLQRALVPEELSKYHC